MGKFQKKIKNTLADTSPSFVLDSIFNYLKIKGNVEEENNIYDKLHLSITTRNLIKMYENQKVDAETAKIRNELSEALNKSFKSLKHGFVDKIAKLKIAADLAQKQSKKANERGLNDLRAYTNGKIHELTPLNFTKSYTSLRFENFRWFVDKLLDSGTVFDDDIFKEIFNKLNITIHDIFKPEIPLFKSNLKGDTNIVATWFYNYKKKDSSMPGEELIWFMTVFAYIYDTNSTFLLGSDVNHVMLEGISGMNFRSEHIRMKLIKSVLEEKIKGESNIEKVKLLLVRPSNVKLLEEICKEYSYNINYFLGMYQPLNPDNPAISSVDFRKMIRESIPNNKEFL